MNGAKRSILLLAVLGAAGLDVLFYLGMRTADRASALSDPTARAEILTEEPPLVGAGDVALRDLGRARLEAAVADLTDAGARDEGLRQAYRAFRRSLALNPLSAAVHIDLAQTLEYMRLFDLPAEGRPMEEYLRAVGLAGRDLEILDRTGTALLKHWDALGPADRETARTLVRSALAAGPEDRLDGYLALWALRVQDASFMKAVLPAKAAAYRRYADFLAERGLERGERIRALAEAERMELAEAREEAAAGRSEYLALRLKEAETHDRAGLALLDRIRYYQALDPEGKPLAASEVRDLRRALRLGLARCRMETAKSLDEILPELKAYLDDEDSAAAVAELEKELRERKLIDAKPDASGRDLRRAAFELSLRLRQSQFREVVEYGQTLESGLVMVTEAVRGDYARVLELVGDAYQKLDFLYESNRLYQKARELAAVPDLALLDKLGRNYERLNDMASVAALRADAAKLLPGGSVDWKGAVVSKGTAFRQDVFLEAKPSRLTLRALPGGAGDVYATILLNGRVVWEDFIRDGVVALSLTPESGVNEIDITPWNGPLSLAGLEIKLVEAAAGPGEGTAGKPAPARNRTAGKADQ